jgi:exonuclease VII small subunit
MLPAHNELFTNERRLLARNMVATLERVKDAVRRFEDGEINLEDALRQIAVAVASRKAA